MDRIKKHDKVSTTKSQIMAWEAPTKGIIKYNQECSDFQASCRENVGLGNIKPWNDENEQWNEAHNKEHVIESI